MGVAQVVLKAEAGGRFFFYGTLQHLPLLRAVLGREPDARPAQLPGHAVMRALGQDFPMILVDPDSAAEGLAVEGIGDEDRARLDFYEGGFTYATRAMALHDGSIAQVYFPEDGRWVADVPWRLEDWARGWGDAAAAAAADVMVLYGVKPAVDVARRRFAMMVRGASRARAAVDPAMTALRRASGTGDIAVVRRREPYANFFAVEEYDIAFRRFDGAMSETVTRAAFVSGDAVTVLPYDPVRDRVHLVEQFRVGPFARGDRQPWQLEAIAGRVDPDETPEEAARREAIEEAGLKIGALLPVASYYPSAGAKTEYLYSFVGLADLPDDAGIVGGVAHEAEDIRGHVVSFDRLMDLVATGEAANAPLILTAFWLARERGRLRAALA